MTPIAEALTLLATLPADSPELDYFTREFNLYLDVVRKQGQRDQFSRIDLHVLFARWQDLAQIAPLPPTPQEQAVAEAIPEPEPADKGTLGPIQAPFGTPIPFAPKPKTERVLQ